jgi:hypothetical protein
VVATGSLGKTNLNWTVSDRIGCVCTEFAHILVLQLAGALID